MSNNIDQTNVPPVKVNSAPGAHYCKEWQTGSGVTCESQCDECKSQPADLEGDVNEYHLGLEKIRKYFLEHDKTTFEHWAYSFLSNLIKATPPHHNNKTWNMNTNFCKKYFEAEGDATLPGCTLFSGWPPLRNVPELTDKKSLDADHSGENTQMVDQTKQTEPAFMCQDEMLTGNRCQYHCGYSVCPIDTKSEPADEKLEYDADWEGNIVSDLMSTAEAMRTRITELKDMVRECINQLEYLNEKFPKTGTTNSLLTRAKNLLNGRNNVR